MKKKKKEEYHVYFYICIYLSKKDLWYFPFWNLYLQLDMKANWQATWIWRETRQRGGQQAEDLSSDPTKCQASSTAWVPRCPLLSCIILNEILNVSGSLVVNQKVVAWDDWNNICGNALESVKYTNVKLPWVIILIIVVFWAQEDTSHFSCFPSLQTKKAMKRTFP